MTDNDRPYLEPHVKQGRHNEGYEIEFEKINRFGERASSFTVSELSLEDLVTLYSAVGAFLDKCEDYQVG